MKLGSAIKELRKIKNISQGELCHRAGISQTSLSQIETNEKYPRKSTIEQIAKGLGESVAVLMIYALERKDCSENKRGIFDVLMPSLKALVSETISETLQN